MYWRQNVMASRLTGCPIAAFVDFLQHFKASSTEAAEQLEGLNISDGDSDEYDMVDDADDPAPGAAQRRNRHSKVKYMQMLQDVADRVSSEITIDLNDLEAVSGIATYDRATWD